ncbi:class I SAM-dependent methyltransferase [Lachnospiraceae bacterium ASD5720]|uniref:Class I SAM-dependent methyltransferase n=2 Tax=Diplocloster agilis TaxID=2850323 RepID=A0A949K2W3_9FIRM|nr:class I SAM-dependent methyltransferase [Diplocloster agilis]
MVRLFCPDVRAYAPGCKKQNSSSSSKLHFFVQDMFHLPYADESFAVIIASNVLRIIPEPEKALAEIKRVLAKDGIVILPTFTHKDMGVLHA